MMALAMIVTLSQCKKQNEENEDNTAKVRISCTIPLNNDDKTDFANILNCTVNWSAGVESIYLAIPHKTNPQIVELTSKPQVESQATLTFTGSVQLGLLEDEKTYDVWYFGNSKHTGNSYIEENVENDIMTSINGAISAQSGSLSDLGKCHIAKATVTANGNTLTFDGTFKNQIAIAHLDLTNVAGLSGEAIVGTDYSLEYIDGVYRLNVTGNKSINITGKENKNESYVVLFPTNAKDVKLNSDSNKKMVFHNGIKQNTLYKENDNKPLIWELPEHECVDLGLPSKVKWATCNIGAGSPEAYGKYYAWGEIEEPLPAEGYVPATCGTYNKRMNDISGHETYDAATANWGIGWRIPTKAQCEELMDANYCTWEWIEQNGGYLVTSKINGNYIFLPAAGHKSGSTDKIWNGGVNGTYSCSTPAERGNDDDAEKSYTLGFNNNTKSSDISIYRDNGRPVRPVTGGDFESPAAQYAEVTTAVVSGITLSTAVCGGNVTVDKYSDVRERGVYYSTSENLIIENGNKVPSASAASGEYTVELTGLQMNTTYYVRAYATTDAGISYGEVKSFTTLDYEYVNLGLPSGTLWATQNVGAKIGIGYEWSATEVGGDYSYDGFGDISGTQYDAATANWGSQWCMPTQEQMTELYERCTWVYESNYNGMKGCKVIGPNGNHIFLPDAVQIQYIGNKYSCYWTSTRVVPQGSVALRLRYDESERQLIREFDFGLGLDNACAIRPVRSRIN